MANEKTVRIGCKLPHGIVLELPNAKPVELNGLNRALIIGTYGETEVDADFWAAWKLTNKDYPALKSGAIFEAKNRFELEAKAKELVDEKTGFEPMPQNADGVSAVTAG